MIRRNFMQSLMAILPTGLFSLHKSKENFVLFCGDKLYIDDKNEVYFKENKYGDKFWYENGVFHREDGPAIECQNGSKYWFKNGVSHRLDGPAVESRSERGDKYNAWFRDGLRYRNDGPVIEWFPS